MTTTPSRHLQHLQPLFIEVLMLCRGAGLLNIGRLSLDGTKLKANASRHKAMSDDRMTAQPNVWRRFSKPKPLWNN